MGLILGIVRRLWRDFATVFTSPVAFLQRPARWMQLLASNVHRHFRQHRTSRSNWRHEEHQTTTWPGLISADVLHILSGSERVQPATLKRFAERFARFNLHAKALRPSYGMAEATVYVATRAAGNHRKSFTSNPRN